MSNEKNVDLDAAPIDGVETAPTQKAPAAAPKATPVEEKSLGITAAMKVDRKSDEEVAEALAASLAEAPQAPAEDDAETKEAKVEAIVNATLNDPDLHINQVMIGKHELQYLDDKLHALYPTDEEQQEAAKDPASMFNLMLRSFRDGWGSNQAVSLVQSLTQKMDGRKTPMESLKSIKDPACSALCDGASRGPKSKNVDIVGDAARDAFMAEISGLKRVKLLNSGFWVVLRRPLIHELQDIFDAADMEQREVGYSIGAHFALVADMFIKQKFCQALIKYRIICGSNLENIYDTKNDVFFKALAFHDYEVLVHAVLSLMSRKGLRARIICPECARATMIEKIDVDSSKYVNLDLVTPEMREWWTKTVDDEGKPIGARSLKDLEHYRKDILGFKYSWTEDFDPTKIRIHFREPTMNEYFTIGQKICSKIQDTIEEVSTGDEDRRRLILANLAAHTYHMLTPWVGCIESLSEDGSVKNRTSSDEAILSVFDITTQENSPRPLDELTKFLSMSKITYIGTFALECPYCHAKPDIGADQFYPLEVQTIFFGQLFRLLPQELMPQER